MSQTKVLRHCPEDCMHRYDCFPSQPLPFDKTNCYEPEDEIETCPFGFQEDEPCCDNPEDRLGIEICEFQCPFDRLDDR